MCRPHRRASTNAADVPSAPECCCCAVAAQHAELQQKGKQVFLKALQGESVFDRCATYKQQHYATRAASLGCSSAS